MTTSVRARAEHVPAMGYQQLLDAFERMMLLRRFDEEVLRLRLEGEIYGPVHPYIGQEAIAVGVTSTLKPADTVLSNHRGHGHCLAKGAAPDRMMSELFGRASGFCGGKGGSMHVTDVASGVLGADGIVGANTAMSVGVALAAKLTGSESVSVCFFGDGATGQGLLYESMNIAALWGLRVVFVCENNGWAADTPASHSLAAESIADVAASFGLATAVADGNDIGEVFAAAASLVDIARNESRPTLIECRTFRRGPHAQRGKSVSDRRPADLVSPWLERDPLEIAAHRLSTGLDAARDMEQARTRIETVMETAVDFARNSPWPDAASALTHIWADDIEAGF